MQFGVEADSTSLWKLWLQRERSFKIGNRLLELSCRIEQMTARESGFGQVRLQCQGPIIGVHRIALPSGGLADVGAAKPGSRQPRIQSDRPVTCRQRLFRAIEFTENNCEAEQRVEQVRIESKSCRESRHGLVIAEHLGQNIAAHQPYVGIIRLQLKSTRIQGFRACEICGLSLDDRQMMISQE